MYSFDGLIRRRPLPTFSDTAFTDRHSDTTTFQLRAHCVRISWSIGSEKSFGRVPPVGAECVDDVLVLIYSINVTWLYLFACIFSILERSLFIFD